MSFIAGLILAAYQLIGLHHGPGWQHLQQTLIRANPQPALEIAVPVKSTSRPVRVSDQEGLTLGATSFYAVDVETMTPLYQKNSDKQLPVASITKMTTALVALKNYTPDQIITIPTLPTYQSADALLHLVPGQQFRFNQLLAATLIPSANDAADSLAIVSSGSTTAFSEVMNRTLTQWGIVGTHFTNPSGLNDTDNYSTAESLAKIAKLALTNPLFSQLTSTAHSTIVDVQSRTYNVSSTNELLGADPRISGIKTGFTPAAGECFVGLATIKGHKVITVVLASPNRFGETKQLLDWLERNWNWE